MINPNLAEKVNWVGTMKLDPLSINGELDCNVSFIDGWIERKHQAKKKNLFRYLLGFL